MSKQDLTRILRAARKDNKRDAALLEFLAATGLRASEVASLTASDVALNERSGWVTVRGKGRKQRQIPLHVRARRALSEYLEERDDPAGDEPLFLSQKGGAITPYAVWYTVKKYAALAEVEDVTPHTFRHTVATQLARDPEVDLVTAATFLGHSRLNTTARYSQPSAEDLEKNVAKATGKRNQRVVKVQFAPSFFLPPRTTFLCATQSLQKRPHRVRWGFSDDPHRTRTYNRVIKDHAGSRITRD
jgi:integrase/recombinase XerC